VSGPARWSASGPSEPVPDGRSHGRAQSDPGIEAPPGFEPPPRPVPAVRPGTGRSLPWTILRRLLLELKQLMLPKSSGRERVWALRVRPALLRAAGVPPAPMPLARVVVESGPAERHFGPGDPVRSILLLKVDHIGDLLLALPAFATLRRGFPDASITLMCGPWNVVVARRLALFDRVVAVSFFPGKADASRRRTFDPGGIAALGLPEFDLAVDLRVDEDSRLLLRHVRARFKAGYFSRLMPPDMALVLPQDSPAAPGPPDMLHHQRGLMGRLAGAVVATLDPLQDGEAMLARVTAEHDAAMAAELAGLARPVVAVNTMSGRDIKNWPLDRFVAVCRWITAELGGTVVLLGGPGDARNAAAILREVGAGGRDAGAGRLGAGLGEAGAGPRQAGTGGARDFVGRLALDQSFAMLRHVDLYLGNDSGLTHAAAMSRVPTVAVFSGIDPIGAWMPLGPEVTAIRAEVGCSPCHLTHITDCPNQHVCIQAIPVATVKAAILRALDGASARSRVPASGPPRHGGAANRAD